MPSYRPDDDDDLDDGVVAEINITPLTDVFLVLLVIFMVTTSVVANQGKNIDLPGAAISDHTPRGVTVEVTPDGQIAVNDAAVRSEDLFRVLSAALANTSTSSMSRSRPERRASRSPPSPPRRPRRAGEARLVDGSICLGVAWAGGSRLPRDRACNAIPKRRDALASHPMGFTRLRLAARNLRFPTLRVSLVGRVKPATLGNADAPAGEHRREPAQTRRDRDRAGSNSDSRRIKQLVVILRSLRQLPRRRASSDAFGSRFTCGDAPGSRRRGDLARVWPASTTPEHGVAGPRELWAA